MVSAMILALAAGISCEGRETHTVTDRAGRRVTLSGPVERIVSTAPSNTEIIAALGMAHALVAIDRHSANVPGVPASIPLLDFFFPDAEVILGTRPDLIIASGHNPTGAGDDPFRLLGEAGVPAVYIPMSASIADILADIAFIADILGVPDRGDEVIRTMTEEIALVEAMAARVVTPRTVYFEISPPPDMMTFGHGSFIDDMIRTIGAVNIFGGESWLVSPGAEAVIMRNPDVILTNVSWADDPVGEMKGRPGFGHIAAVAGGRVFLIDNDSSVRASPGIILALRQMMRAVYPEFYEER